MLALGSGLVTYLLASDYDASFARLAKEDDIQELIGDVLHLMVDAESAQQGYAITGDSRFLGPYLAHDELLPQTLRALNAQLGALGEDARGKELGDAIRAHDEFTRAMVDLVRDGRADEAREQITRGEGRRRMERVRELSRALDQRHERSTVELAHKLDAVRTRVGFALGFGGLLTLAIAGMALLSVRRDLQAMDAATRALEQGERRFRLIAESSSDLIRVQEVGGRATYASPSALRLLGYSPEELLSLDESALLSQEDLDATREAVATLRARGEQRLPLVHRVRHKDGTLRWFETRFEAIFDEDGVMRRFHSASRDVTERVERERVSLAEHAGLTRETELLREISLRDELTKLLNRRGLLELGARLLASASQAGQSVVVHFLDIDGLKEINDRFGHEEGDRAIVDTAGVLVDTTRGTDLVARLGGDEFIVLGVVRDSALADAFRERLTERIERYNSSSARPHRLSMSVGSASARLVAGSPSLEDLLAAADAAMYEEKKARKASLGTGAPSVRAPG